MNCKEISKNKSTENNFQCEGCDKSFTKKRSLERHRKVTHEGYRENCTKCSKTFTRKEFLISHIKTVHSNTKPEFKCESCNSSKISC